MAETKVCCQLQYSAIGYTRNLYKKPRVLKCHKNASVPKHSKNVKKPRVPYNCAEISSIWEISGHLLVHSA